MQLRSSLVIRGVQSKQKEERKKKLEELKRKEEELGLNRPNQNRPGSMTSSSNSGPSMCPFGAAAGKPSNVSTTKAIPFGAAAGKPANVSTPKVSPFGATAGKPANVSTPKFSPFGAAAGKPAVYNPQNNSDGNESKYDPLPLRK